MASSMRSVPERVRVRGVLGGLERNADMTLRRQVVDLIRLRLLHDADQIGGIGQVAVVQVQANATVMRILVEMIDAIGIERGGPAFDAVNLVALLQQQLRQVGAVLAGDTGDQRSLHVTQSGLSIINFILLATGWQPAVATNRSAD